MSVGKKHYETKCPCQKHVVLDLLTFQLLLQEGINFHNIVSDKAWLAMGVTGLGGPRSTNINPLPSLNCLMWLSLQKNYTHLSDLHTEPHGLHLVNLNTWSHTCIGGLYEFYKKIFDYNFLILDNNESKRSQAAAFTWSLRISVLLR